jgi:hypothetical protein
MKWRLPMNLCPIIFSTLLTTTVWSTSEGTSLDHGATFPLCLPQWGEEFAPEHEHSPDREVERPIMRRAEIKLVSGYGLKISRI